MPGRTSTSDPTAARGHSSNKPLRVPCLAHASAHNKAQQAQARHTPRALRGHVAHSQRAFSTQSAKLTLALFSSARS
jgi:hypothetical protein